LFQAVHAPVIYLLPKGLKVFFQLSDLL